MAKNNRRHPSDDYIAKPEDIDRVFATDLHFKSSFAIGSHIIGDNYIDMMDGCALVILKPESFILGKAGKILQLLDDLSLAPLYYKFVQFNSAQIHDVWKYQWVNATLERIIINCQAMEYSKILVLIIHGHKTTTSISANLSSLKGSAIAAKRKGYHLRSKLDSINIVLNFIHASDNTYEMIREMGIVFPCGELPVVYEQIKKSTPTDPSAFRISIEKAIHETQFARSGSPADIQSLLELSRDKLSKQDANYNKCQDIVEKLRLAYNGEITLDYRLMLEICKLYPYQWPWEWIVVISTLLERQGAALL